jgi:hypothetical protein
MAAEYGHRPCFRSGAVRIQNIVKYGRLANGCGGGWGGGGGVPLAFSLHSSGDANLPSFFGNLDQDSKLFFLVTPRRE